MYTLRSSEVVTTCRDHVTLVIVSIVRIMGIFTSTTPGFPIRVHVPENCLCLGAPGYYFLVRGFNAAIVSLEGQE